MADTKSSKERRPIGADVALAGILALLVDEREARPIEQRSRKTELILADAGLSNDEIAAVTGKNPSAVRMAISRAKG